MPWRTSPGCLHPSSSPFLSAVPSSLAAPPCPVCLLPLPSRLPAFLPVSSWPSWVPLSQPCATWLPLTVCCPEATQLCFQLPSVRRHAAQTCSSGWSPPPCLGVSRPRLPAPPFGPRWFSPRPVPLHAGSAPEPGAILDASLNSFPSPLLPSLPSLNLRFCVRSISCGLSAPLLPLLACRFSPRLLQ